MQKYFDALVKIGSPVPRYWSSNFSYWCNQSRLTGGASGAIVRNRDEEEPERLALLS